MPSDSLHADPSQCQGTPGGSLHGGQVTLHPRVALHLRPSDSPGRATLREASLSDPPTVNTTFTILPLCPATTPTRLFHCDPQPPPHPDPSSVTLNHPHQRPIRCDPHPPPSRLLHCDHRIRAIGSVGPGSSLGHLWFRGPGFKFRLGTSSESLVERARLGSVCAYKFAARSAGLHCVGPPLMLATLLVAHALHASGCAMAFASLRDWRARSLCGTRRAGARGWYLLPARGS